MAHAAQIVDDLTRTRDLTRMIERYAPDDQREADFRRRMLALLASGGEAFSRRHFTPGHFTASAFVLSPDRTSLVLVFHRRFRRWLQPGGHIDPEDVDVFAAARREVAEETGVFEVDFPGGASPSLFDLDVHPIPSRENEPAHEHFDLRILVRARGLDLRPASDARDAKWVKIADVAGLEIETDASVLRAVAKLTRHERNQD